MSSHGTSDNNRRGARVLATSTKSGSNRLGQSIPRQIFKGLEETQRCTQQETQGYLTRKRQSPTGTKENKRGKRERARPILGSNETDEEKKDNGGQTSKEETQGRCIPEDVSGNHKDYPGIMVRA
mmetsp:Transcript_10611/g.12039  ORF Transcript_10611/g.12039 Transcript_10611/m.12039 type:complete len:125 (-) Transcript_10611:101-475(-)